MSKLARIFLIVVLVCSALPMGTAVEAKGPCICPMVYAPVQCSNGKVYSNQCVANCHHATDCVPLDGGPIPVADSSVEPLSCDQEEVLFADTLVPEPQEPSAD